MWRPYLADLNSKAKGTVEGVQDITGTSLGTAIIHRYLNMAYYQAGGLSLSGCGGTGTQGEIENFLAAHFMAMSREQQAVSESVGGEASVHFRGQTGQGLQATLFGQAAISLDCSGKLAKASLKKPIFQVWDHDDIDYDAEGDENR